MKQQSIRTLIATGIALLSGSLNVSAQPFQPSYVIHNPTAGLLEHGFYEIRGRAGPESSLLAFLSVGFKSLFQIGASFGMQNVLGYGSVDLNDKIGFQARIRLIEETNAPALALGFDNQGHGRYADDLKRYDRKSPGFFVVVSKNYTFGLGQISWNGGVSFTTEREDDDDPNLFFGIGWTIKERVALLLDTDAALNDNVKEGEYGQGGIYIDGAIRWYYGESLMMTLIFADLTDNSGVTSGVGREFDLAIVRSF